MYKANSIHNFRIFMTLRSTVTCYIKSLIVDISIIKNVMWNFHNWKFFEVLCITNSPRLTKDSVICCLAMSFWLLKILHLAINEWSFMAAHHYQIAVKEDSAVKKFLSLNENNKHQWRIDWIESWRAWKTNTEPHQCRTDRFEKCQKLLWFSDYFVKCKTSQRLEFEASKGSLRASSYASRVSSTSNKGDFKNTTTNQ